MQLFNDKQCVDICLKNSNKYVALAVEDLIKDFARVSKACVCPKVVQAETDNCIVIQENSNDIAQPLSGEEFSITVSANKAVISADGYLGTMWGIYTFSEKFLGVDPCYLFNDLAIQKRAAICVQDTVFCDKPTGYGFRGIFINDEDLLTGWKQCGGVRHVDGKFYNATVAPCVIDMVVETALRLKFNLVIPATFIDIDNPKERLLLDCVAKRGIFLSQHHCEPLGVSSFNFANFCKKFNYNAKFSYSENPQVMEEVWQYYVKKWAEYPNVVWQIGLRGMGDDRPIWQDDVPTETVLFESGKFISKAYQKQVSLINKVTNSTENYFTSTLWMEGSLLVQKGYLKFPKNVTTIFADTAPTQIFGQEYEMVKRQATDSYGIYYHLQYYGCGPHLVPQTGLQKLHYCLKKAFDKGDNYYVIMNASNVREFVFELGAYSKMTWNMNGYSNQEYLDDYCKKFGDSKEEVKRLINDFFNCLPETDSKCLDKHLSKYFNYDKSKQPQGIKNFVLKEGSILEYGKRIIDNFHKDLKEWLCCEYYAAIKPVIPTMYEIYKGFESVANALPSSLKTHLTIKWVLSAKTLWYIYNWYVNLFEAKTAYDNYQAENMVNYILSAANYLKEYLAFRKCAEYGEFINWYRGDLKMNVKQRLYNTLAIIGYTPDFV